MLFKPWRMYGNELLDTNGETLATIQWEPGQDRLGARLIAEAPAMVELLRSFVAMEDEKQAQRMSVEARALLARIGA